MSIDKAKKNQRKPLCMQGAGVIWSKASASFGVGGERSHDRKQISIISSVRTQIRSMITTEIHLRDKVQLVELQRT